MSDAAPCPHCGMPTSPQHLQQHVERFAAKRHITEDEARRFLARQAASLAAHKQQREASADQAPRPRLWITTTKETPHAQ